jgi:hypothetical protein
MCARRFSIAPIQHLWAGAIWMLFIAQTNLSAKKSNALFL